MAKILVYNQDTNRMETFFRGENEQCHIIQMEH